MIERTNGATRRRRRDLGQGDGRGPSLWPLVPWLMLAFVLVGLSCGLGQGTELVVRSEAGDLLWHTTVVSGERVRLRYMHSVAKRPVEEIFVVEEDRLLLVETVYDSFGAGLPTEPDPGARFYHDEATASLHIVGMSRAFPVIRQRVGTIANHELILRDQTLPLASLAQGGDLVSIGVETRPQLLGVWR